MVPRFREAPKGEVMGTTKILIVEDEPNMVAWAPR